MKLEKVLKKLNKIGTVKLSENIYSIKFGNKELTFTTNRDNEVIYFTIDELDIHSFDSDNRTFLERYFKSLKKAIEHLIN